jgi:DNA-binding PucR family transcriptional regulator
MTDKTKRDSPLVASVLALQHYLDEMERIGNKINSTDMSGDVDIEHVQKLMTRFAECGQGVSEEVRNLSGQLQHAQTSAEAVAEGVARQAQAFKARTVQQQEQLEKFQELGEKVRALNTTMSEFRRPSGQGFTEDERGALRSRIPAVEGELVVLIAELQDLRDVARSSQMKKLEKDAESLAQTLKAVHGKLREFV